MLIHLIKVLIVMAFSNLANNATRDGHQRYYLPKIDITNYNAIIIIDERNFYDNDISSGIEKYTELKKSNDWKRRRLYYRIFSRL